MDYEKHYNLLILKAKTRFPINGYTENHHIVPRSMGGSNLKHNIVKLSGREHFVAHLLLHKIYPNHLGMVMAISRMRYDTRRVINSKKYEWIKHRCRVYISEFHKKHAKHIQNRPETKEKHRANAKNQWKDEKYRNAMSLKNLGKNNPMYGKKFTDKSKLQLLASRGMRSFKVWKSICIRPDSPKMGIGEYEKGEFVGEFINKSDVEKLLKVRRQLITRCLRKEIPQTAGYIFEY